MRKDAIYIDTPRPKPGIAKLPSGKKSIPERGQPIEAYQYERLFSCHYCGSINTTGRDQEGGPRSTTYSLPRVQSVGNQGHAPEEGISVVHILFHTKVAPIAGADGTARKVKNVWAIDSYTGCPACGTTTWSGR